MNIRLHKDHGLNPTMSVCIVCGEDTGEIALLGAGYKGEAPMRMVTGIEPCEKCRAKYLSVGVLLVEMEERFEPKKHIAPTGRVTVLKDEAFTRIFEQPVPKGKIAQVEVGILDKLTATI